MTYYCDQCGQPFKPADIGDWPATVLLCDQCSRFADTNQEDA